MKPIVMTLAAMAPVVWLALSRFYWNHFDHAGSAYLAYNVARLWMLVVLLAAFWATGTRLSRGASFVDAAFGGAAVWSIGVVLLAAVHLFYPSVILSVLAVAVWFAASDLLAMPRIDSRGEGEWGLVAILLKLCVLVTASTLLFTIALWGNFGGDNDVPGNYLPYYESVLTAHTNGPNTFWVHFFASKGHGLGLLANALSDVQGASLVSFLMLVLGAALIRQLVPRDAGKAWMIALVGVCLYFQFYAGQGAYAKSHIVRNTLMLYVILSAARRLGSDGRAAAAPAGARIAAIVAIVVLSPLAAVLLLPILLLEIALLAATGRRADAWRSLPFPAWAIGAATVVCLYNYLEVGLLELHNMPSAVGRFTSVARLREWIDPGLAFLDDRLTFIQTAIGGAAFLSASHVTLAVRSWGQVLPAILTPSTQVLLAGGAVIAAGVVLALRRPSRDLAVVSIFLLAILAMVGALQMLAGGAGSSMVRFTDFASPIAIALAVLLIAAAWSWSQGLIRVAATGVTAVIASAALYVGYPLITAQHWLDSVNFFSGGRSYADMYDDWDTGTGVRIAATVPSGAKVELFNFVPGLTAVPASPFQRPDNAVYIKDYTTVLYAAPDVAASIYARVGIEYFLFDVSNEAPVVWSGFSPFASPASVGSRMRVIGHDQTDRHDFYLLTTTARRDAIEDPADKARFLDRWRAKLAAEQAHGIYHAVYENGRGVSLKE